MVNRTGRRMVRRLAGAAVALLAAGAARADAPPGAKAYVANTDSDDVSVIDLSTGIELGSRIPVGNEPRGCAPSPLGDLVYVANRFSGTVSVIDTAADAVVDTIAVTGSEPYNLAVTPDGAFVYVVCKGSSTVSVIDSAAGEEVDSIDLSSAGASPEGIAITPDGSKVYVVNRGNDTVDVIETAGNTLAAGPIPVGSSPRDAAVSGDGTKVIVVGEGDPVILLTATDSASASVLSISGSNRDVAVRGNLAYLTNFSGTLDVVDLASETVGTSIALSGSTPYAVALDPLGTSAWVAFVDSGNVVDVDLVQGSEGSNLTDVGNGPRGIAAVFPSGVVSYMLPRTANVRISGPGRDTLQVSGFFDDGGASVDFLDPVTLEVGGFSRTFTLVPNRKGTAFAFKDTNLRFRLAPRLKGSSRGKFSMLLTRADLAGLIDPDAPLEVHFRGTNLPDARGTVGLTAGRYRLGKVRGTLSDPAFFPAKAKAVVSDAAPDRLSLRAGFRTSGPVPEALGDVEIRFGPGLRILVPGGDFVRSGDTFRYSEKGDGYSLSIALDFAREVLTLKTAGLELGALDAGATNISLDTGTGPARVRVILGAAGGKRTY